MPTFDAAPSSRTSDGGSTDAPSGGENVLVLASADTDAADAYCAERLSSSHESGSTNALIVSLDESPDRRFEALVQHGTDRPSRVAVVCCDRTRSAAAASSGASHSPDLTPGPWIATVESPGDLTGLGVRIRQVLSAWGDGSARVELCFHSLERLVEHVDDRAAFRFCHAITRHINSTGASSHFHLDPDAVGERTVNTLTPLFDRVVDRT